MRYFRALFAIVTFAGIAVGCESEASKTPPPKPTDLGAPASPNPAPTNPNTPPTK